MAVPSAFGRLHLARAVEPAHLERGRSRLARDDGLSCRVAAIRRPGDLSRRPAASARRRTAHVGRVLDREVGWRRADGHRHAPERRVSPSQRTAAQRQGDAHRALDSQRRSAHGDDHHQRPGLPHRALRAHDRLRARPAAAGAALSLRRRPGGRQEEGRDSELPARHQSVHD